ncbi:MAG: toxin-antitoxin system YwqK family antitoxin, partial [Saprospiraceae bacterium]
MEANIWRLTLLNLFAVVFLSCGDLGRKEIVANTTIDIPEKEILKDTLVLHVNEGLVYYLEHPFSGYSVDYYPNGVLVEKISYWQGKKQGTYQKWYADGTLSFEANYEGGRKNGLSKTWWRDGVLRSESTHEMGITNGNQRQWYQSGQLFKSINIVDD